MKKDPLKNPITRKLIKSIQKIVSDAVEGLVSDNNKDAQEVFIDKVSNQINELKIENKLFDYKVFVNPKQSDSELTGCIGIQLKQGQKWIIIDYVVAPDKK